MGGIMKKFIITLILVLTAAGCAGVQTLPPQELTVRKVLEVPGMTKEQIFDKSKLWIARNFKPYKAVRLFDSRKISVLEYANKMKGILIATGTINYPAGTFSATQGYKTFWEVTFTMEEDIKDGRVRVTFSNLDIYVPKLWCGNIYSEWLGAYDKPLTDPEDMTAVTPVLNGLADKLGEFLRAPETEDNW
jgi:hypothetical protein